MREAARAYCSLVGEEDDQGSRDEDAAFAHRLLTALADAVASALRLPDVEPSDAESPVAVSHEQWHACHRRIGQRIGAGAGCYWEASYPFAEDEAQAGVGLGDLVDDLADVWRDLENGLLALDAGMSLNDVQWQWRQDYWTHWGHHAAGATRALLLHSTDRGHPSP